MTAHGNSLRVVLELVAVLLFVPLLGLLASLVLWLRARHESDPDRQQYLRIGWALAAVAFLAPLCADCLRQPAGMVTRYLGAMLPVLCLIGILGSLAAAVLVSLNGRGAQRFGGALLGLLGLLYCGLTLFAYGVGGAY